MKYKLLLMSYLASVIPALAAPSDLGRILDEGESSGPGFGLMIILIIGAIIIYNMFAKEGKEHRGCIAVIVAVVLLFTIVYIIHH